MSRYEIYRKLDKWYRWQLMKTCPTYLVCIIKQKLF